MRFDIHVHFPDSNKGGADAVISLLNQILSRSMTMVTQVEFDLKLDQLAADAANERAEVQAALGAAQASNDALAAEVQALKDQLAAGVVVTQAQLDSMAAKADAVSIAIKGVYDAPAAPV